jgi:hypothetical protein
MTVYTVSVNINERGTMTTINKHIGILIQVPNGLDLKSYVHGFFAKNPIISETEFIPSTDADESWAVVVQQGETKLEFKTFAELGEYLYPEVKG